MIKSCTCFVLLQLIVCISANAGEISHAAVDYSDGIYTVEFDASVNAQSTQIYNLLTDYNQLYRLNDSIVESADISAQGALIKKSRLLLHTCITFFCRDSILIEDVQGNDKDEVIATVDPVDSDFVSGQSIWKILQSDKDHTSITLRRNIEPGFWFPPVIGPWLIKKKMIQELSVMIERLEQFANARSSS